MGKSKRPLRTFKYNGLPIKATIVDATKSVILTRTFLDALNGKKADEEQCMDANCILRHAKENKFPHPVLAVWVTKSRAFILSKAVGNKFTVVRYEHDDGDDIMAFDKGNVSSLGEKQLILRRPSATTKLGADPREDHNRGPKHPKTKLPFTPRGIGARFISLKKYQEHQEVTNSPAPAA